MIGGKEMGASLMFRGRVRRRVNKQGAKTRGCQGYAKNMPRICQGYTGVVFLMSASGKCFTKKTFSVPEVRFPVKENCSDD